MSSDKTTTFDPQCRRCHRLACFLSEVKKTRPDYHCAPVPPFGDPDGKLLIVGLAPGKHGANASGRPFTGDYAGILLYRTLHKHGLSSRPRSTAAGDGLRLHNCRITNAVKCLPPDNKPVNDEIISCNAFLQNEVSLLPRGAVVLALGTIAHKAVLRALGLTQAHYRFIHGKMYLLEQGLRLIDSYHCSRYNTQTGRLTTDMFDQVIRNAAAAINQ